MAREQEIQLELSTYLGVAPEQVRIARERRLFAEVPLEKFRKTFEQVVGPMQFSIFCIITGQDEGDNLTFLYTVARTDGTVLNLKTAAPKSNPAIPTITDLFPAATVAERELVDLLGTRVEGIPQGKRYPLPDNWPTGQYPLRKDWKPEMLNLPQPPAGEQGGE